MSAIAAQKDLSCAASPPPWATGLRALMARAKEQLAQGQVSLPRWLSCRACHGSKSPAGQRHTRLTCPLIKVCSSLGLRAVLGHTCGSIGVMLQDAKGTPPGADDDGEWFEQRRRKTSRKPRAKPSVEPATSAKASTRSTKRTTKRTKRKGPRRHRHGKSVYVAGLWHAHTAGDKLHWAVLHGTACAAPSLLACLHPSLTRTCLLQTLSWSARHDSA